MALIEPFVAAIGVLAQPQNMLLVVVGVVLGMSIGVIPGMGSVVALALVTPLTFGMDPVVAFMLLAAVMGGVNFGGSITAILLNVPGSGTNAATIFDGYPMAQQGRAGEALGASAAASALGATIGIVVVILLTPLMQPIILLFGPPEVFWLAVWGLTMIAVVAQGSPLTGLVSAGLGLLFAFHGFDPVTGTPRYTYGLLYLQDGIKLIPALVGLFAVGEMINLLGRGGTISRADLEENIRSVGAGKWEGVMAVVEHKFLFVRSALIGTLMGIIPGVGGTTATYVSYFQAAQLEKDSDSFGEGDVRGVIASEAANDAKDGGGFLPTLGLGIPGSAAMAVLLSAFILHGIQPGPLLLQNSMDLFAIILTSLFVSNVLTSVIGLSVTEQLAKITLVPVAVLAPVVTILAFIGAFTVNHNVYDLYMALGFGVLGYLMLQVGMSRVPLILGLVLGPIAERNFNRALQISSGDYGVLFHSPLSLVLIALVVVSLATPYVQRYRAAAKRGVS